MLGEIEGERRRGQQRMSWLDSFTDSVDMNLSKLWEIVKDKGSLVCCSPWGHRVGRDSATERQQELRGSRFSRCAEELNSLSLPSFLLEGL